MAPCVYASPSPHGTIRVASPEIAQDAMPRCAYPHRGFRLLSPSDIVRVPGNSSSLTHRWSISDVDIQTLSTDVGRALGFSDPRRRTGVFVLAACLLGRPSFAAEFDR